MGMQVQLSYRITDHQLFEIWQHSCWTIWICVGRNHHSHCISLLVRGICYE